MEVSKDALPPSPPMTDSSSPSTGTFTSPRESPPFSPQVRSTHSNSPSVAVSPLPGLPPELFLNVLSYLSQPEVEAVLGVSRSWHSFLVNEPSLWHTVEIILSTNYTSKLQRVCARSNVNGRRSNGGIRSLIINVQYTARNGRRGDILTPDELRDNLTYVFDTVAQASVLQNEVAAASATRTTPRLPISTLRSLSVSFHPNTNTSAIGMYQLSQHSQSPLFANLESLFVQAALPGFKISQNVLNMWPNLKSLHLFFPPKSRDIHVLDVGNWTWQPPHPPSRLDDGMFSLDRLERLTLDGVRVIELNIPLLPRLKHFTLTNVQWEGRSFYYILRLVRKKLESLDCGNLTFDIVAEEADDWDQYVNVRDPDLVDGHIFREVDDDNPDLDETSFEPAPIALSSLQELRLSGSTPAIFVSIDIFETDAEYEVYSTPVLFMPAVKTVLFEDIQLEPEGSVDDAYSPLAWLGRQAPKMTHLRIERILVGDIALSCCLAALDVSLEWLELVDTMVTDHFIVRLPDVAPMLKHLNVRASMEITNQGVARAVEVMRIRHDEGDSKLETVLIDPPTSSDDPACFQAYRWLDFVGVLVRDDEDFEGLGPTYGRKARTDWIKEGKKDEQWEFKERYEKWEKEQKALIMAKLAAEATQAAQQGGSGSSDRASAPAGSIDLSAFNTIAGVQARTATFPSNLAIPQYSLAPTPAPPAAPYNPNTIPLPLQPAPVPLQQFPSRLPPNLPPPPPLVVAPQPQPPPPSSVSAGLDLTCLDSLDSFEGLDPELLAEQRLAMQQAQERNQRQLKTQSALQQQDRIAAAQQQPHPSLGGKRTADDAALLEGLRRGHQAPMEQTRRMATPVQAPMSKVDATMDLAATAGMDHRDGPDEEEVEEILGFAGDEDDVDGDAIEEEEPQQ